ncbi:DUF742 domain-containing protein [Streptomyces lydicus]|nr:DUF742 domain-containing protein [Streptomyces lydicus]
MRLESVVVAAPGLRSDLGPDAGQVQRLFAAGGGGLAVADIAAALQMPPSTARILVSQLVEAGCLGLPVSATGDRPETELLQRVLDGLHSRL